jgi:hypothetical protein
MKTNTKRILTTALVTGLLLSGCNQSQEAKDRESVQNQQSQYAKSQPIPAYRHSMERELLIKLYNLRNEKVLTHTVWRSDYGMVEGDCASMGYGLPYDTSLTNPLQRVYQGAVIGQAEPNGIFASTNTSATWVMCIGGAGSLEPIYVEGKVTVYPYEVKVDYKTNRVQKSGDATATINN